MILTIVEITHRPLDRPVIAYGSYRISPKALVDLSKVIEVSLISTH